MSCDDDPLIVFDTHTKEIVNIDYEINELAFSEQDDCYEEYIEETNEACYEEYLEDNPGNITDEEHDVSGPSSPKDNYNTCGVKGCIRKSSDPGAILFSVARGAKKHLSILNKWVFALKLSKEEIDQNLKVCDIHFEKKCFSQNYLGNKRLHDYAFPTKFLPINIDGKWMLQDESIEINEKPRSPIKQGTKNNAVSSKTGKAASSNFKKEPQQKHRKEIVLKDGTVLKQVFTSNTILKKKPTSPLKKSPLKKSQILTKDGKILTPVKLKPKAARKRPERERSIILLDNGAIVFKKCREDQNRTNEFEISNLTPNHSMYTDNSNDSLHASTAFNNFTNVSSESFNIYSEETQEQVQEETQDQLQEESQEQVHDMNATKSTVQKSPKVLFKDGKLLKQVKFKKKPPPPPIMPVTTFQDSLTLDDIDHSAHTIEYIQEFDESSQIDLSSSVISKDTSMHFEEEPPMQFLQQSEVETSLEYVSDSNHEAHQFGTVDSEENQTPEHEINVEFQTYTEAMNFGRQMDNLPVLGCVVPGCNAKKTKTNDVNFIVLNSNCRRYEQWIKALGLRPPFPSTLKVCFNHFTENDFLVNHTGKQRLHPLAIPSLNMKSEEESRKRKHSEIVTKTGLVLKPVKFKKLKKAM